MKGTFTKAQRISLGALAAAFFLSASLLAVANLARPEGVAPHFDWPDETSNAFFAGRFAETGKFEAYLAGDVEKGARYLLVPRSFNFHNGALVPAGFLGLPFAYGIAEKVFGSFPGLSGADVALFLTPFLSAIALLAFAFVAARIYGARAGTYAAFALAFAPAWWYHSAYSYLPNVPAVALAISAAALGIEAASRSGRMTSLLAIGSGACLGAAAAVRPNDAFWYAIAFAVAIAVSGGARRHSRTIGIALVAAVAVFSPILIFQRLTYGGFLSTGYSRFADGAVLSPTEFSGSASSPFAIAIQAIFLPYGLHPRAVWYNLWRSWLALAPWASLPAVAALAWRVFVVRRKSRAELAFLAAAGTLTLWLVVSYGSWMIADPLVLKLNTIGVSHVRYWIPLSVFGAAVIGAALGKVAERGAVWRALAIAALALMAILSARMVYVSEKESLIPVAGRVVGYGIAAAKAVKATPADAVLLTDRTDKEIFPDRQVTGGYPAGDDGLRALRLLACDRPLYLYASWSDDAVAEKEEELAALPGVAAGGPIFSEVAEPRPGYRLWKLDTDRICLTGGF